jgi:hypothetical protein
VIGAYYDYMFSIVDLPLYSCMESYSPRSFVNMGEW